MNPDYMIDPRSSDWLQQAELSLHESGFVILDRIFDQKFCAESKERMDLARLKVTKDLETLGLEELPFVFLLMHYDPFFFRFLAIPELLSLIDFWIGPDAILRNQLGQYIAPDRNEPEGRLVFRNFHRQFRHIANLNNVSLDVQILFSRATETNGAIALVPGSHRYRELPSREELLSREIVITADQGSVLVIDGMLWHREKVNTTNDENCVLIQQFTLPIIKQYFDFPRLLNGEVLKSLDQRTLRLLGCFSLVPASLEEYLKPTFSSPAGKMKESQWLVRV